jgi:8-oxo-dGTP pyrophosphatase MutT (NUDIX family)
MLSRYTIDMNESHVTESAGGVVLNSNGEVLVVNQKGDSWSLPKGHIDPGETAEEAARRETYEETGIKDMTLVRELGTYERYKIGKDGEGEDTSELKRITMFLFDTTQTKLHPVDENHPEARWVSADEVASLLTHPKDAAFFEQHKTNLQ